MEENKHRTFNNLIGYCTIEACINSDGEVVEGTERNVVLLFNKERISVEEVDKMLEDGTIHFSDKVIIIPKHIAINLSDILPEERKSEEI